jgi:hypothetical protein
LSGIPVRELGAWHEGQAMTDRKQTADTIPGQWTPPLPHSEFEAMLAVPVTLPADDLPQPPCGVEAE